MQGFWWRLVVAQVSTCSGCTSPFSYLEFLASLFSAVIFEPLVPPPCRLLLQMDATAAFYTLVHERMPQTGEQRVLLLEELLVL